MCVPKPICSRYDPTTFNWISSLEKRCKEHLSYIRYFFFFSFLETFENQLYYAILAMLSDCPTNLTYLSMWLKLCTAYENWPT